MILFLFAQMIKMAVLHVLNGYIVGLGRQFLIALPLEGHKYAWEMRLLRFTFCGRESYGFRYVNGVFFS